MKPHLILAALDEAIRHEESVIGRYEMGCAYAQQAARDLLRGAHQFHQRSARDLPAIDKALRAWIARGPDWDTQEYQDGYLYVQEQITSILDGDVAEVVDLLQEANERARAAYTEAAAASSA